jgi:hypothetical protein
MMDRNSAFGPRLAARIVPGLGKIMAERGSATHDLPCWSLQNHSPCKATGPRKAIAGLSLPPGNAECQRKRRHWHYRRFAFG